jgi:precorrin-2 methylase
LNSVHGVTLCGRKSGQIPFAREAGTQRVEEIPLFSRGRCPTQAQRHLIEKVWHVSIALVAIGPGEERYLTLDAHARLSSADAAYVMAKPSSWIIKFLSRFLPMERIHPYYPRTVAWAQFHNDEIFRTIANQLEQDDKQGRNSVVVVAGDVSLYGHVSALVPHLRALNLKWEVSPGISFLNAIPILTGEPLVREGETLLVSRFTRAEELDAALSLADVVALYEPKSATGLADYVKRGNVEKAVCVTVGTSGNAGTVTDLIAEDNPSAAGIALIRRKAQ